MHQGIHLTLPRVTSLVALTLCASVAQAQSTAPKELSALLASQAAAEALTSCEKLGHKVCARYPNEQPKRKQRMKETAKGNVKAIGFDAFTIFKKDLQSELVAQLAANPAAAALTSVPGILLLPGAVLIKSGDEVIGSIGVGGAPSGLVDEGCAKAGVERIASSVK
ncbi:MAG: heme-binding protein [Betaproteobacteria bacterium]|nr:MAG: heme-binding protein [Betaproteobacteria bacterium]